MSFADGIILFNRNLELKIQLHDGVKVMNPFHDEITREFSEKFYKKFYNDDNQRTLILGINPGRFGAGLTGIPFTDPVKLEKNCGISNPFHKTTEPSAGFVYDMITAFGSPESFFKRYFIHAVCPLGFTREGLNYNYYDSKVLQKAVTPFIMQSLKEMLKFAVNTDICYCLGNGKNFRFLSGINAGHHFFKEIIPLPHPRWIIQYRRKRQHEFIERYLNYLK